MFPTFALVAALTLIATSAKIPDIDTIEYREEMKMKYNSKAPGEYFTTTEINSLQKLISGMKLSKPENGGATVTMTRKQNMLMMVSDLFFIKIFLLNKCLLITKLQRL